MFKIVQKLKNNNELEYHSFNFNPGTKYSCEYKIGNWSRSVHKDGLYNKLFCFSTLEECINFLEKTASVYYKHFTIFDCSVINPQDVGGKCIEGILDNTILPEGTIGCDAIKLENEYKLSLVYKVIQKTKGKMYSYNTVSTQAGLTSGRCIEYKLKTLTKPVIENSKLFVFSKLEHAEEIANEEDGQDILKCVAINCKKYSGEEINRQDLDGRIINSTIIDNTYLCDSLYPLSFVNE